MMNQNQPIEPRVAALEVGLDRLTADVSNLTTAVREQGNRVESQIQQLVVATTQAQAPKKTDWATIISAVMLVLAIGSAVFWPLNQVTQENKENIHKMEEKMQEHSQLTLHPVGQALVAKLEYNLKDHAEWGDKEHQIMTKSFIDEIKRIEETHLTQLKAFQEKNDLHNERLYGRVVKLEERNGHDIDSDLDELKMWRLRAAGVNKELPK